MNPLVRMLGKVLRLVGISSPEDNLPRVRAAADPPNWRDATPAPKTEAGPPSEAEPRP